MLIGSATRRMNFDVKIIRKHSNRPLCIFHIARCSNIAILDKLVELRRYKCLAIQLYVMVLHGIEYHSMKLHARCKLVVLNGTVQCQIALAISIGTLSEFHTLRDLSLDSFNHPNVLNQHNFITAIHAMHATNKQVQQ